MYLLGWLPDQPRLYFFGPQERDMRRGFRNRLMRWGGVAIPFRPGRRGLLGATGRAIQLLEAGSSVAVAGEGRIHSGERVVLSLHEGAAYLSVRAGVPLVPVAVNGTGWLAFRRPVRLRIGQPLDPGDGEGQTVGDRVARLNAAIEASLRELVSDFPEPSQPGPFGRWLTELFNVWPEGRRPRPPSTAR